MVSLRNVFPVLKPVGNFSKKYVTSFSWLIKTSLLQKAFAEIINQSSLQKKKQKIQIFLAGKIFKNLVFFKMTKRFLSWGKGKLCKTCGIC